MKMSQSILGLIAFINQMRYIIAPSSLAGRGLGVGFLYLTRAENRYIFTGTDHRY